MVKYKYNCKAIAERNYELGGFMPFKIDVFSDEDQYKYKHSSRNYPKDEKNNAFLVRTGKRYHYGSYILYIDEKKILISAKEIFNYVDLNTKDDRDITDILYVIDSVKVHNELKIKIDDIKKMIVEALIVYGYFGCEEKTGKVDVEFDENFTITNY